MIRVSVWKLDMQRARHQFDIKNDIIWLKWNPCVWLWLMESLQDYDIATGSPLPP